jgi:hypothetical protein
VPKSAKNSLLAWKVSHTHRSAPAGPVRTPTLGNHWPTIVAGAREHLGQLGGERERDVDALAGADRRVERHLEHGLVGADEAGARPQLDVADLDRGDVDPAPAVAGGGGAPVLAARLLHEHRRLVLERVEVQVQRHRVDRRGAAVGPAQRLGRLDAVTGGVEARVDRVAGEAGRPRRAAAAQRGLVVGLRQALHLRRPRVPGARSQREAGGEHACD